MKFLLALSLGLSIPLMPTPPNISATPDGEQFTITFEEGADRACTIFEQVKPTDAERYNPVFCWELEIGSTRYQEDWFLIERANSDWIVYAAVGYPTPAGYTIRESNRLTVHR